ncbi:MAG TPA: PAS domain-containing protein, partial [Burkholderiales bacterium]
MADLEYRLAELQLQLAAANRDLQIAHSELQVSTAKLRDSEEMTRSTLDALKISLDREKLALAFAEIGTCEFDVKSRVVRSSDMSLRLFGIRGDRAELPYDTLLESLHQEDRPKFNHALEQCLSGTGNLEIEYRVAWADGSFRWLRTKGDALLDLEGDPIKVLW